MKKQNNGRKRAGGRRFLSVLLAMSMILTAGSSNVAAGENYSHQHTDACYERQLTCTLPEEGHVRDEACYTETPAQLCGLEESEGHTHGESCYAEDGMIVCTLPESQGHVHSDACQGSVRTLNCGLAEQGHVHTEACYENVLVCNMAEGTVFGRMGMETAQGAGQMADGDQISTSGAEENTVQNPADVQTPESGQISGADGSLNSNQISGADENQDPDQIPGADNSSNLSQTPEADEGQNPDQTPGTDESQDPGQTPGIDNGQNSDQTIGTNNSQNPDQTLGTDNSLNPSQTPGTDESQNPDQTLGTDNSSNSNQTPGTDESPNPSQTPGADESQNPSQTPGADESQDPSQTPGAGNSTNSGQTPGTDESPNPSQTPGADESQNPNQRPGADNSPNPSQTQEAEERSLSRVLICEQEEQEDGHVHTEECYRNFYCGQQAHVHTEKCYDEEQQLICGKEEHEHSEACFVERPVYCEMEEHLHTAECYDEDKNIVCEKEEHIHERACYRIPGVSEEDQERIEALNLLIAGLPSAEEALETMAGYEKGSEEYAGALDELMQQAEEARTAYEALDGELGQYVVGAEKLQGLAEALKALIERITYCGKAEHSHATECFDGNGNLICKMEEHAHDNICYQDPATFKYEKEYSDGKVIIHVTAEPGVIPADAELVVIPIEKTEILEQMSEEEKSKAEEVNQQYDLANRKVEEEVVEKEERLIEFVAYDISFQVNGKEIEPNNGKVEVTMEFMEAVVTGDTSEDSTVSVYHLKEDEKEEDGVKVEDLTGKAVIQESEEKSGVEKVEVAMDSFSMMVLARSARAESGPLDQVATVDSSQYITINMINYPASDATNTVGAPFAPCNNINYKLNQGILSNKIEDGQSYPTFTSRTINCGTDKPLTDAYERNIELAGASLGRYFSDETQTYGSYTIPAKVKAQNGLFLKDNYEKTGYYHFSSAENGVSFNSQTGMFEVYQQLTTTTTAKGVTSEIGNFVPFNTFDKSTLSGLTNQYDMSFKPLMTPEEDPLSRKGELLYLPKEATDFHYGMEMLTTFYQREGGLDPKGQETVFKFTGDDDLWIYIDGVLVLDIGGCHRAMSGEINFTTGMVSVNVEVPDYPNVQDGAPTVETKSLYEIFQKAGALERTEWKDNKTFADRTTHDFKMWYMERGEGAANLAIDFNLSIVPTDGIAVEKNVEGAGDAQYIGEERFAFRVMAQEILATSPEGEFYKEDSYVPLTDIKNGSGNIISDENGIFYLKNGERASVEGLQLNRKYYVEEICVDPSNSISIDTEKFSGTKVNGIEKKPTQAGERTIIQSDIKEVSAEKEVVFTNQCVPREVYITKTTDPNTEKPSQENESFEITVQFKTGGVWKDYAGSYSVQGVDGIKQAINGKITLSKNQTAVIPGLVKGMEYRVFESAQGSFTEAPVYQVTEGTTSATIGAIEGGEIRGVSGTVPAGNVGITMQNANLQEVLITKRWVDGSDSFTMRPEQITVSLEYQAIDAVADTPWEIYSDRQGKTSWTVTAEAGSKNGNTWTYRIGDLPSQYRYRVKEVKVGDTAVESALYETTVEDTQKGTGETNPVYTATVQNTLKWQMVKCSASDKSVTLAGAEFELIDSTNSVIAKGLSGADGIISWISVTDNKAQNLIELADGIYTISESKAHPGYAVRSWTMRIKDGFPEAFSVPTNAEDQEKAIAVFYLENEVLYELPSTGGRGIFWYMISGTLLLMASVLVLYKRKYAGRCGKV